MSRVVTLRLLTIGLVAFGHAVAASEYAAPWGRIDAAAPGTGRYLFVVERPPSDHRLAIPRGFPQVTRAVSRTTDLPFEYDSDGAAFLVLRSATQSQATVETGEESRQFDDGRIVLTARDARVTGATAKLESQPGNHRIGFWTNPHDDVSWDWKPTRWGAYEARLTFANASPAGSAISVAIGNTTLEARLESTGSWYRYTTLPLGRVVIPTTGTLSVTVRCTEPAGSAVMNLKALTLTPAGEGATPRQSGDRSITLHGRDATVRGTMLRWEPAEKKQTLGFWTRASDAAEWTFAVDVPGTFDVEVLQGCGSGQGGSEMGIVLDPQTPTAADIAFTVEDTGGFQKFRRRTVGRVTIGSPGEHLLRVQPRRIANQAACDIREIRLVPTSG